MWLAHDMSFFLLIELVKLQYEIIGCKLVPEYSSKDWITMKETQLCDGLDFEKECLWMSFSNHLLLEVTFVGY